MQEAPRLESQQPLPVRAADVAHGALVHTTSTQRASTWPWYAALLVVAGLAAVLRCANLAALSLWVDEGLTVLDSHLPWSQVLGLNGAYAAHPPLYFSLVKGMAALTGDLVAGRLVSAVAGALTVPVLYALVARLAGRQPALVAAMTFAVAPLPLWYSREARPYALMTLLVAVSYLALVSALQRGRAGWLAAYLAATALALYTDESAVFALAPQCVVALVAYRRDLRRGVAVMAAALAAVLLYVPWAPQVAAAAPATSAQAQFALTPAAVAAALRAVSGLDAPQAVFAGGALPPWDWGHTSAAHPLLVLAVVAAALVGVRALWARSRLAAVLAVALGPGVVAIAVLVSLRLPSLAPRTVLPATLGWSILLGSATLAGRSRWSALLAWTLVLLAVAPALLTDGALATGAYKQNWRDLAADAAVAARLGWPLVTYPTVAGTLITVYQPALRPPHTVAVDDGMSLPKDVERNPVVWLAYPAGNGEATLTAALRSHGFVRLLHQYYPYPLYLDLYARPTASFGRPLPPTAWRVTQAGQAAVGQVVGPGVPLLKATDGEEIAYADRPARPGYLYTAQLHGQVVSAHGSGRVFLECLDGRQAFLRVLPDAAGATIPADGRAHVVRVAALCPSATVALRVDLRADDQGVLRIGQLQVTAARPRTSGA